MKSKKWLGTLGALALFMAACGPAAQQATATPARPAAPAATATPSAKPTSGPTSPTATPAAKPAITPASGGQAKYGGVLRHRIHLDANTWDTGKYDTTASEFLLYAYPRLFSFYKGQPGEEQCRILPLQPELATGFKWVDDTTLDITLRQGVKLPTGLKRREVGGQDFAAEDVVFNFKRYFLEKSIDPIVIVGRNTQDITAVDRYTVRFKLKTPYADFIQIGLASMFAPLVAPEIIQPQTPSGTIAGFESHKTGAFGAFRPTGWSAGVGVDFEKNRDYFLPGLPYLDGISLKIIPDDTTFMAAMRSGRVDSGFTNNPAAEASFQKLGVPMELCPFAGEGTVFMKQTRPEFQDINVRRAMSMAIDREAVVKILQGFASGAYSLIPPMMGPDWSFAKLQDWPPEVRRWLTYDPQGAKDLMAKSAYPRGFTTEIMLNASHQETTPMAEYMVDVWSNLGIQLKLRRLSSSEHSSVLGQFPWDQPDTKFTGLVQSRVRWGSVDETYNYFYSTSPRNRSVVRDPKVDRLLEEQRITLDPAKRQQIVKELQLYIVDQMYAIPMPVGTNAEVHQPYVKGIYFKNIGAGYDAETVRDMWLDK